MFGRVGMARCETLTAWAKSFARLAHAVAVEDDFVHLTALLNI